MYGIWSTAHAIGEGLTFIVSATLVAYFGWKAGFWAPGLFCILVAVGIYFNLQDRVQTFGLPTIAVWKKDHTAESMKKETLSLKTLKVQCLGPYSVIPAGYFVMYGSLDVSF